MKNTSLSSAVENFAASTHHFTDPDLERPWDWNDYKEGVRFAFFRTYEQLCELAARLEIERNASAHPFTIAQRILGQYHAASRDLQAVLQGVTDELAAQVPGDAPHSGLPGDAPHSGLPGDAPHSGLPGDAPSSRLPAEGEWPLRQVLAHIVQADRGFFANINYGLERARTGDSRPQEMTEDMWNTFWADAPFAELSERGTLAEMQAYHHRLHPRILHTFSGISADELHLPIYFWEGQMPLEFRLHRFSSHMRQHTIQAEKTLAMLCRPPSETMRLLRIVYSALAAVESVTIGDESFGLERQNELAEEIARQTGEITKVVG